jgi:hypothetical protein
VVAEERDLACAPREEVGALREEGFLVDGVGAVKPQVVEEHGDKRDDEEGGVDVGYEVGFREGVVCEDGLSPSQYAYMSWHDLVSRPNFSQHTLARKLLAVHRNTVASSSAIPIACLSLLFGFFLLSLHMLTTLAGDRMGLSRKSFSRMYRLPFETSLTRGLSGVVAEGSSISSRAILKRLVVCKNSARARRSRRVLGGR